MQALARTRDDVLHDAAAQTVLAIDDSKEVLQHLETPVETLLQENACFTFDWHLAEAVCEARVFSRQLAFLRANKKVPNLSIQTFMREFIHDSSRQDFLAFYIEAWNRTHPPLSGDEQAYIASHGLTQF